MKARITARLPQIRAGPLPPWNRRDPHVWIEHVFRDIAEQVRALGAVRRDMDFGGLPDILGPRDPNDWDPDKA